jgi:Protein of unknown function (DUF3551)
MLHIAQRPAAIGLGLIALALICEAPAKAQSVGGWGPRQFCTTRFGGPPTCAYSTWEQCLATIRGTGLSCQVNPFYRAQAPARTSRHRSRRADRS